MAKARITFKVVVEYNMKPEYYEDGSTPEQMLGVDIENANDDPMLMIGGDAKWEIVGELIGD